MTETPIVMKVGMAVAFVGAIIAFVAMAQAWNGTVDSLGYVGVDMAVSMMFFATAGSLSTYSPVKGSTVVLLAAIAIAFSIVAAIYGAMDPFCTVVLVILGAVCVFIGNLPITKEYVDANRVI